MSQSTAYNACISLLSSRTKCLPLCLESIHEHFNYKHNYPIYVHYFDDIYDGWSALVPNVQFIRVPYKTPEHIKEEELFYHRDNKYARGFGIGRKGYLHMCHFICNMYEYPNTRLHEHDYIMVFDDDSGLTKELPFNPIDKLGHEEMAAAITGQRLKDGKPPQNHIDTRENLWCFFNDFCEKTNRYVWEPLNKESTYHYWPWSDGYVINTRIFKSDIWKEWIKAVNKNGGIYKHRWGDNELMSLFYYAITGKPIPNLGLVEGGYLIQGLYRDGMAPGVKDNSR